MFGSLFSSIGDTTGDLRFKLIMYIIIGVVVLMIVSLALDGIRRYIRGLDFAALGALLIWFGSFTTKYSFVKGVSDLMYLVGGTLLVVGIIVFVLFKVFRHKRNVKYKEQQEWERQQEQLKKETAAAAAAQNAEKPQE